MQKAEIERFILQKQAEYFGSHTDVLTNIPSKEDADNEQRWASMLLNIVKACNASSAYAIAELLTELDQDK